LKITKSILKKIIKEEIIKEMMGGKELSQIRHLANPPGNKSLLNILKAYYALASIEDANMKSMAHDYFMEHFGKGAFELANRYSNHDPKSGERLDLSESDLSGWDLSGAYLRGANLNGADLRNANLTGADLINSSLFEADLTGADLTSSSVSKEAFLKELNGILKP
jgi:uncharacterized protein YjbI with pentapeptide repeats